MNNIRKILSNIFKYTRLFTIVIAVFFLLIIIVGEKTFKNIQRNSQYHIPYCDEFKSDNFTNKECNLQRLENKYPKVSIYADDYNFSHYYTTMYLIFNVDSYSEICPQIVAKRSGLYYVCHIEHEDVKISDTEIILTLDNFAMRPRLISEMPKELIEKLIARTKLIKERTQTITNYKNFIIDRFSEELKKKQYE